MTTIINTPTPAAASPSNNSNGISGLIIGIIFLVIIGAGLYYFALPAIRQMKNSSSPLINVPNQIDVNIKQTK